MLEEIEKFLGYPIKAEPMPLGYQKLASCSINFSPERGWCLWYIPETKANQALYCHELSHLVLLIEGWPSFIVDTPIPKEDYRINTIHMLTNLVSHIEVWKMVRLLGFDETTYFDPGLQELIQLVESGHLLIGAYPTTILPCRAAYLAQGLLGPAESETQMRLRNVASHTMPQALELADSICQVFERLEPLSPQLCVEALSDICGLLKIHRGILIASWPDRVDPNFRSRILACQNP
jgi:hypothetical protein